MPGYLLAALLIAATLSPTSANVAFMAEISENRDIEHNTIIVFDRVVLDTGNNFYPEFGLFVCPDNDWDWYVFTWSLHAVHGRVAAKLMVDSDEWKEGPLTSDHGASQSGTSSMSVLLQCTPGSAIRLNSVGWPNAQATNRFQGGSSTFSGFKVSHPAGAVTLHGFSAELIANQTYNNGDRIVFDRTVADVHGDYNENQGVFTCPRAGVFIFSISAHLDAPFLDYHEAWPLVLKNNVPFHEGPYLTCTSSADDTGSSTMSVLMECQNGDTITVESSFFNNVPYIEKRTGMTGYLLAEQPQSQVAFFAFQSENVRYLDGNTIKFDRALTNVGNHYKPLHGLFECPDNSLFVFMWSVIGENAIGAHLMLGENEVKTGLQSVAGSSSSHTSSSMQAIVPCELGKAVYVKAVVGHSELENFLQTFTSFLGFRLPQ